MNTIYVTAGSASDIPAVQQEIARLLPSATITTPSSLANAITGSLSSAAKLANDLGKWLSGLVLIAAFAVPLSASVSAAAIVGAVLLALAGALIAGSFGSWLISRLRPADALTRVG